MVKANLENVHKQYNDFVDKFRQKVNFEGNEMWLNIKISNC